MGIYPLIEGGRGLGVLSPSFYCTNVLCTSQLLARSGSLHHLRAAGCGIGDEGAVTIAQGLAVNRSLKTLDLGYVGDKAGELCPWSGVGTAYDSIGLR